MVSAMEFNCKLAHCEEMKKISGFNSTKELYEKVHQIFSVPVNDIMFCTLNTHNFRDMDSLLGSYLSLGDLIVVHMCGNIKNLTLKKNQEYLGLTITDNGNGRAFVKKVKSNGDSIENLIKPGDHIAGINNESTVGMRHYEVARTIRDVPQQTNFTLQIIEPLSPNNKDLSTSRNDSSNGKLVASQNTIHQKLPDHSNELATDMGGLDCDEDLINSSLPIDRLLSKGDYVKATRTAGNISTTKHCQDSYRITIESVNSILESFLGINDNTLAVQIYRLAKENETFDGFSKAVQASELSVFNFGHEIETYLWRCVLET